MSGDDKDAALKLVEKEISELRTAKKHVCRELERIDQRERECVDKLLRLMAEKHDGEKQEKAAKRLSEVESELKQVKCENVRLKEQLQNIVKPVGSLPLAQRLRTAKVHTVSEPLCYNPAVDEQLNRTKKLLSETRQRLSDVQERLTVAEQVTAATQQRALQESDNSKQLQLELELELTPQRQPTIQTGFRQNVCLTNAEHLLSFLVVTVSTVVLNCCKGDKPSQWETLFSD